MADRRSVRPASRRKSPTPQPPSKAAAPQMRRASQATSLRSASRQVDDFIDIQKPDRRSARQASVTTNDESEHEPQKAHKTKRKPAKEPLGDLTVVEEMDTQIDLEQEDETLGTPTSTDTEPEHASFQSPGAASQMSGTTAISSFSMVEAEFLEPRFILKHLRKLCDSAEEFLEHIAPDNGTMREDLQNIQEMQKPGSTYMEDYLDLNDELNVHLKHFKSEEHSYIHIRALHRALFKTSEDVAASQSGLDLILYLTNLLVLAKQMIHSNRDDKNIWDVLRQLDNTFPAQFMQSLGPDIQLTAAGESALYKDTFDLALELRTQLAILVLQREADTHPNFDAEAVDTTLGEVFGSESSEADQPGPLLRGWNMAALGGDDGSTLPRKFQVQGTRRVADILAYVLNQVNGYSSQRVEGVHLEKLKSAFPWEPTILRLLDWVRLRHRELKIVIDHLGGPFAITQNVKQALENPQPVIEKAPQESLHQKRTSIGRGRRRSSRRFDPTARVDMHAFDKMVSREGDSGVCLDPTAPRQDGEDSQQDREISQAVEEVQDEQPERNDQEDNSEWQTLIGEEEQQPEEEQSEKQLEEKQIDYRPAVEDVEEHQIEDFEEPQPSAPPKDPAALLKALKALQKPQKENRPVSIFDRQTTAQRVEFGDGFDGTLPTPGQSNTTKRKQPAESSPRKRRRSADSDEDEDSDPDAFETSARGNHALQRRRKLPFAKKQRMAEPEPISSGAPSSHQPPPRPTQRPRPSSEQEESVSEVSAPSMTEEPELPPSSTWRDQRKLAQENRALDPIQSRSSRNERKAREAWSNEEEEALIEYMSIYPSKYSRILQYDEQEGGGVLRGRNQVNLKDKARNLAINMIRSGAGLRPGFENIIHPGEKQGRALMAAGWIMHDDGSWERAR